MMGCSSVHAHTRMGEALPPRDVVCRQKCRRCTQGGRPRNHEPKHDYTTQNMTKRAPSRLETGRLTAACAEPGTFTCRRTAGLGGELVTQGPSNGLRTPSVKRRTRSLGLGNNICVWAGSRHTCLLYTSPSPRDGLLSRMPSSA